MHVRHGEARRIVRLPLVGLLIVLFAVTAVVVGSPAQPRSSTISAQNVSSDQTNATSSTCGPLAHLLGVCRTTTTTTTSPNAVNMHTPMPATTKVDWVRVWQYG
jgi:hypothetical protein